MNLNECITLAVSHHPKPYRQIRHYWKWKIVMAGMKEEILVSGDEYDRDSFLSWLRKQRGQIIPVHFDADVKLALHGKDKKEVNLIVNEAVREKLNA